MFYLLAKEPREKTPCLFWAGRHTWAMQNELSEKQTAAIAVELYTSPGKITNSYRICGGLFRFSFGHDTYTSETTSTGKHKKNSVRRDSQAAR